MIANHAQFINAIHAKSLTRIVYYSQPDAGQVDHECAPLDYGPEPKTKDGASFYWVWDNENTTGSNPLRLSPDQIVELRVLGKDFKPAVFQLDDRQWNVSRDWGNLKP